MSKLLKQDTLSTIVRTDIQFYNVYFSMQKHMNGQIQNMCKGNLEERIFRQLWASLLKFKIHLIRNELV
uniref:Uncharacterized protein n=1 Tax=viral metagenome TaxID=1070528 RepID=A0A6M3KU89_9ZZZZ